jgi:general secretion pathway protein M
MTTLSAPVSRALASALAVGLVWLVVSVVIAPFAGRLEDDLDSISRSRQILARYDQLLAIEPALRQRLDQLKHGESGGDGLLEGHDGALLQAELQARLQQWVASAGASLRSSRILPKHTEDGFDRIGLEVDLAASPESLRQLLYTIETAEPASFVDALSISVPESGQAGGSQNGQQALNVRFNVFSYARSEGS